MDERIVRGRAWWDLHPRASLDDPDELADELRTLATSVDAAAFAEVRWVVSGPTGASDAVAEAAGFHEHRDLLQLRRSLPVGARERAGLPDVALRPFTPGRDEPAWLAVNARAFADHPDQGRTTADELARLEAEPWFDPSGFLLLDGQGEGAGRLDGFCWTRVHPGDPPLGEIFVIGVDPDHHGQRIGPALTVAGLDHLHRDRGIATAMLYVEATNRPARAAYDRLGFTEHHRDRAYLRHAPARP